MSASSSSQPQDQPQQRSQSHARSHSQRNTQSHAYEFTKRKKWTDILVANLPETAYLLLDVFGNIQFASRSITGLLGWEPEELTEKNVLYLLSDEDNKKFGKRFLLALADQEDLACYARLKRRTSVKVSGSMENEQSQSTQPKELLFDIRGGPYSNTEDAANRSFYLMAKPYPSRNKAMLNAFLELKAENDRLTEFLEQLRLQESSSSVPQLPSSATSTTVSPSQYVHRSSYGTDKSPIYDPGSTNTHEGKITQGTAGLPRQITGGSSSNAGAREDEDEGGKKKKLKKYHGSNDQHVCFTCGRTDSPEWRKGPRGPKTLCNACGLRWAKRSKKPEDANTNPAAGSSGALSSLPADAGRGSSEQEKDGKEYASSSGGRGSGSSSSTGTGTSNHNSKRVPVVHAALSVTPVPRSIPSHSMISQHPQTPSLPTTPPLSAPPVQSLGSPRQFATHHLVSSSGMTVSGAKSFPRAMDISMASGILAGAPSPMGMSPQSHHPQHAHVHGVQEVMQAMPVANEYSDANVYNRYPTWDIGNAAVHRGIELSPESTQAGSSQHGQDPSSYRAHEQSHHQSQEYNMPFSY